MRKNAKENGDTKLTLKVNLPKLQHEWSEWENADETIKYPCTAERKQIRMCAICGATEERLGGETNHTWDSDNVTCTACGYFSNGHHILYVENGGIVPASLADLAGTAYRPSDMIPLWQPSSDQTLEGGVWTKLTATGQAVFMGWSKDDLGAAPLETEPETEYISSVTIPDDANAIVYAVWAADRNKNSIPDYQETPVSIIYNANGGTGKVPDPLTGVLPSGAYLLETAPDLKQGAAIFAGWSETPQSDVIKTNTDPDDIARINSLVASPYIVPGDAAADIDLYAVYAEDDDGDGKPNYNQDALHVEYYINGGEVHPGYTVDGNGMFYVCNDYHHPGERVTLLAVEYGSQMIDRENAVLIGWSQDPHEDLVTSKEEAEGLIITEVDLTSAASNAKVYALWAEDVNNNHIADYEETKLQHTYYQNQFLSDADGVAALGGGQHLNVDIYKLPSHQPDILPGTGVELADNNSLGSADVVDRADNVVGGHYVHVGWSATSHDACKSKTDYDNWVIADDDEGYTGTDGKYYRVIYDTRYENAYAIWALDENQNKIADFRETYYTVTLDINGGTPGKDGFPHMTELLTAKRSPSPPTPQGKASSSWAGLLTATKIFTRRETQLPLPQT